METLRILMPVVLPCPPGCPMTSSCGISQDGRDLGEHLSQISISPFRETSALSRVGGGEPGPSSPSSA